MLANMCNQMALNGSVCQGFTYDSHTSLAVFKGQAALQAASISTITSGAANTSLWWLDAGKTLLAPLQHCTCCPLLGAAKGL